MNGDQLELLANKKSPDKRNRTIRNGISIILLFLEKKKAHSSKKISFIGYSCFKRD